MTTHLHILPGSIVFASGTLVLLLVKLMWLVVLLWLGGACLTLVALARQHFVLATPDTALMADDAPLVSILVPARNEEHRVLRACLRSILAQDYGNFEVVAVNDRSTDATGLILRSLAESDRRLRAIDGAQTPAGWLGKPYAMQQALDTSGGLWILATDADMIFTPAALRTAVAYATTARRGCDAITFIPHFEAVSFWERVFIPAWYWSLLLAYPLDLINHPRVPLALGIGGFFLMRRETLEGIGGYGAVRAEVLEDVRLAEELKRAGAHVRAEYAPRLVSTRMYTNLRELWEGTTKNWFAGFKFSLVFLLAGFTWTLGVAVLPPLVALVCALAAAFGVGGDDAAATLLFIPSALALAVQILLAALINRRCAVPAVYALAAPLGFVLSCGVMLDSALRVTTGRGVTWKGRKIYERGGVRRPRS